MFCINDCFFYVWFVSLIYKSDVFSLYWHNIGLIMVNKSLHVFNFFPLHVLSVFLFLLRDLHFTYFVLYFMWFFFYILFYFHCLLITAYTRAQWSVGMLRSVFAVFPLENTFIEVKNTCIGYHMFFFLKR